MKLNTIKFALLGAMGLLLLAGVLSLMVGAPSGGGDTAATTPPAVSQTPDSVQTDTTPAPVTPLLTLTPQPVTPTPVPTAPPAETPQPTPEPAPTPVPTPAVRDLGSGGFRSETGVSINLVCSWSAKTNGSNTAEVTVRAALESYALHINASADALRFTVGGSTVTVDMPAINTDTTEPIVTELGTVTIPVSVSDGGTVTVPVTVEWLFGGVYSHVQLDVVTASGSITLSR